MGKGNDGPLFVENRNRREMEVYGARVCAVLGTTTAEGQLAGYYVEQQNAVESVFGTKTIHTSGSDKPAARNTQQNMHTSECPLEKETLHPAKGDRETTL
jgi:hypothetical protein